MLEKSKVELLCEQLRERVQTMAPDERLQPVRQLMQEYSYSQLTVMQALARLETEGKVYREPGKGFFVRNSQASEQLRIGMVIPDWPAQNMVELEEVLKTLAPAHGCQIFHHRYPVELDIHDHLPTQNYDALILVPYLNLYSPNFLYKLSQSPIPVVLCGVPLRDIEINCVYEEPLLAGNRAAAYLVSKGHRKLAIAITEPISSSVIRARYDGFMMLAKLNCNEVTVIDTGVVSGEYTPDKTYQAISAWLKKNPIDFTALYVLSDETALAAMRALCDHGVAIPEQVSVMGTDGLRRGAFFHPPLTTLGIDYNELAQALFREVKNAIGDRSRVFREFVAPQVIERSSVKDINSIAKG